VPLADKLKEAGDKQCSIMLVVVPQGESQRVRGQEQVREELRQEGGGRLREGDA
jgi:hypothetical protein